MSVLVLTALGWLAARNRAEVPTISGARMAFHAVLGRVLPYGMCVMLGSIGFGTLATFITLYYGSQGWANPAWCLTAFGVCFAARGWSSRAWSIASAALPSRWSAWVWKFSACCCSGRRRGQASRCWARR